jgi:hypothetical protein
MNPADGFESSRKYTISMTIDPGTTCGAVALIVSDLDRSLLVYGVKNESLAAVEQKKAVDYGN